MQQLFGWLKHSVDYLIFGVLGVMAFLVLWMTIERLWFYWRTDIDDYQDIHALDRKLTQHLTLIYTIGANAPYVGLLGTVIGILITFYDMGQSGGDIEASKIMIGLALALKATALGILVAIPSMMFYNGLSRKVDVRKSEWQSRYGVKTG